MLCRVPRYFGARIAEPDDRLHRNPNSAICDLHFFFSSFLSSFSSSSSSFLPFLMTSGSAVAAGAAARFGRRRHFLGLRHDHVDEHHVGVAERLPLRVGRDVAHADALVQHQLADVDLDVLRNVGRQALDLDLAADELEDAALLLDALRLALDDRPES